MSSPLKNLSQTFANSHATYIGYDSTTNSLDPTTKKTHRLSTVFTLAQKQIQAVPFPQSSSTSKAEIEDLRGLKKEVDFFYKRYEITTKTWSRRLLKLLAKCTPTLLQRFFPCFNKIKQAEKDTKDGYNQLLNCVNNNIFLRLKNDPKKAEIEEFEEEVVEGEKTAKQDQPSLPDSSKKPSLAKKPPLPNKKPPLKGSAHVKDETEDPELEDPELAEALALSLDLQSNNKQANNKPEEAPPSLIPAQQAEIEKQRQQNIATQLESLRLSIQTLNQFTDWPFSLKKYQDKLKEIVQGTCFLIQADKDHANEELAKLGLNQETLTVLSDPQFSQALDSGNHQKILDLLQSTPWQTFFQEAVDQQNCQTQFSLKIIKIKGKKFSQPMLKNKQGGVVKEKAFENYRGAVQLSFIKDPTKSQECLEAFIQFIITHKDCRPHQLTIQCEKGAMLTLELLELLKTFSNNDSLKSIEIQVKGEVHLEGPEITDTLLQEWIVNGYFEKVHSLYLANCPSLTTDCLLSLAKLSGLTTLSLPDLPQGKLPLSQLPQSNDPFKIKLLYTPSLATESMAPSLYTGRFTLAALFQIPLARHGAAEIFPPTQISLDPKSVACWLFRNDFEYLTPQLSIKNIVADSNGLLNDTNLVAFMKKFPNVTRVSLYNCPFITAVGVINLLQANPKIKELDLTNCPLIDRTLFFGQGNFPLLKRLDRLIISGTGIESKVAHSFTEQLPEKFIFDDTRLTITDDSLTNQKDLDTGNLLTGEEALDQILKKQKMTQLKYIDLSNCSQLTDSMLNKLLAYLNAGSSIQEKDGSMKDNPHYLNLATLNLTNCLNITDTAFHATEVNGKIVPLFLGTLNCVVIEGTQISGVLKDVFPQITFQEKEAPFTIQIDPATQLKQCCDYQKLSLASESADSTAQQKMARLKNNLIHDRIVVELFPADCSNPSLVKNIRNQKIDLSSEEFCDFSLLFSERSGQASSSSFLVHRDVLSTQSTSFATDLRAGGRMSQLAGSNLINQHATLKATQALIALLYEGLAPIKDLDWETAAHTAELVGPKNFNFPSAYYEALLGRIHSQFELGRAHKMLVAAAKLEDSTGTQEYEATLSIHLDTCAANMKDPAHKKQFYKIVNLAKSFPALAQLRIKVDNLLDLQTKQAVEKLEKEERNKQMLSDQREAQRLAKLNKSV